MQRIPSFSVDHTKLKRGVYLSRQDDDVMTWDLRMLHTIEHLFATFARNSQYKDGVIYVGPMGCRTGFYFLTRGLTDAEVLDCIRKSFRFMTDFEGEIPGAHVEECGNYLDQDLEGCHEEAKKYVEVLKALTPEDMRYTYYLE